VSDQIVPNCRDASLFRRSTRLRGFEGAAPLALLVQTFLDELQSNRANRASSLFVQLNPIFTAVVDRCRSMAADYLPMMLILCAVLAVGVGVLWYKSFMN
jgi:hypothetical protein